MINQYIEKEDPFEDIRLSNSLFAQVKVADFVSLYFSLCSTGLSIVAYEKDYDMYKNKYNEAKEETHLMILMWIAVLINILCLTSIILRHYLYLWWMQSKKAITRYDTIRNTGQWKTIVVEVLVCLIMPYPFLNDYIYYESYQSKTETVISEFKFNAILLCIMTFIRLY
jgi:uncharacterized membrane protein YidH (DUF202 family)